MLRIKEREKLKEISKEDELLERIYEELDRMSKDKKSLLEYSKYELEMEGFKEQLRKEYELNMEKTMDQLKKEYELNMEKTMDQLKKETLEEGLEKGIIEGSNSRNIEIAKNMIKDNMDIETISKYTGLSTEEIKSLK